MNRRDFLKILAGGAVAAVVPAVVLSEPVKTISEDDIRRAMKAMDDANIPQEGRYMVVHDDALDALRHNLRHNLRHIDGRIGSYYGIDIYRA